MIPSKSANVQQKGAENLKKKTGPFKRGLFLMSRVIFEYFDGSTQKWAFWEGETIRIVQFFAHDILTYWTCDFLEKKKPDAYWFVLAVWGYLFIPHIFKTLSESWAGSEDFGAFEIFHFLSRFASRSVEERWNVCRAGKGEKLRYSAGGRACW